MAIYIAPGVYSEEIDQSLYIPMISTSICGIVGPFKKGEVNKITTVTSRSQFIQDYGKPLQGEDGFAAHAALYFLRFGNILKILRVGDENAAKASADITSSESTTQTMGVVRAVSEGTWGNGIQVTMSSDTIPNEDGTSTETIYIVKVFASGDDVSSDSPLEVFTDVVFDDSSDANYAEKVVNDSSLYIEFSLTNEALPDSSSTWTLSGGNDGTSNIDSNDIITGLNKFQDPTSVDVNLLSAPGFNHDATVANQIITICLQRMDCLGILDVPDVSTVDAMVDYVRGEGSYTTVIPSCNRVGIYAPWIKINDTYNDDKLWAPPSVRVLGTFAYSDRVAFPWYAAAGPNRGILYNTLDVRKEFTVGDVETIYGNQNNINPIRVTIDGILIDGNKNLQRKPSLMQNINVIRMLMYAEKAIATAVRYLQWEPHDPITWRQYEGIVNPFLSWISQNRGITQFKVKCDEDTNTPYYINNNQMMAELHIIPTVPAEKIVNRYIIHPHGATLEG